MPKLSFSAYAEHRGCSKASITRAIQDGRITAERDPRTGRRVIDVETADRQWAENTDMAKREGSRARDGRRNGSDEAASDAGGAATAPETGDDDAGGDDVSTSVAYGVSRARKEYFAAELAKLNLEQKAGSLVPSDEVRRAAFETARAVREAIMSIPDRLAAQLAGETDPARVHSVLTAELARSLEALAT